MKTNRSFCTLALAGILASGTLFAQEPGSAPEQAAPPSQGQMDRGQMDQGGRGGMHRGLRMDPDERLARMTKRYKLTSDQQSQIKPILADEQQQMQSMRGDQSGAGQEKMDRMRSMRQADNQKIEAILTDDQRKKFESDQQKMQERRAEHMGSRNGREAGSAPSAAPEGGSAPAPAPDGGSAPQPQ